MGVEAPTGTALTVSVAAVAMAIGWALGARLARRASDGEDELAVAGLHGDAAMQEIKLVLVVRSDLKMGKGKAAAQCCHATLAAYKEVLHKQPKILEAWESHGQPKVVIKCEDEATLLNLRLHARSVGLAANVIQDAGRTQVASGSKTVLAIGPGPKDMIDTVSGHLKLF